MTCLRCVGQAFRSSFASLCKICFWPKISSVRRERCSRTEGLSSCLMGLCLPLFLSHLKTGVSGFMNIFWPDSRTQTWFTGRLMKMIFFLFTEVDRFLHYLFKGYFIFQPPVPSFIFLIIFFQTQYSEAAVRLYPSRPMRNSNKALPCGSTEKREW